mgnify:CR=1 FL=1
MNTKAFEQGLPKRPRIYAPLINGEAWIRNLCIPGQGPFTGGGSFYMEPDRKWLVSEHARRRGQSRRDLEDLIE